MFNIRKGEYKMEVFHVGDKVFLDNVVRNFEDFECYGTIEAINTEDNLMTISPLINHKTDWWTDKISVHIDSPHIHKIDFLPKEKVVIHDLLKDYYNKKGIINAYDITIDRYRVMINNEPHWFAPFELTLKDNDGWSVFSSFNPIKVRLSDEGKKAYEYHFGIKPLVDTNGRTEFINLAQLMEIYDSTFIYGDKYMLEDDDIFVKVMIK
jgi:hypothetical protein